MLLRLRPGVWSGLCATLVLAMLVAPARASGEQPTGPTDEAQLPGSRFFYFNPDASALLPTRVVEGLDAFAVFLKSHGVADLDTQLFRHAEDMERAFDRWVAQGEDMPWFGSMSVSYMVQKGYLYGYEPIVCASFGGTHTFQYSVLVRRNSDIQTLEQARGKIVALADVGADAPHWMDAIAFDNKINIRSHFSKVIETDSPTSTVTSLLFNAADVAIVMRPILERMTTKAQRVWRSVREIYVSRDVNYGGVVAWVGAPPERVEKMRTAFLGDVRNRPGGLALLDTFHIEGFSTCTWADFDRLEASYLREAGYGVPIGQERERIMQQAYRDFLEQRKIQQAKSRSDP
ncbi:MAG: PhnD/SsuA/transferrin family substrate-binding protein [Candidatus Schekmanbacteria bacterium]|nr:PhnD/SsuA/transferrin family substrate-binding protein [Candidatus Schekmanbacteria bacterium]